MRKAPVTIVHHPTPAARASRGEAPGVRAAYDRHLQAQQQAEREADAQAQADAEAEAS